MWAKLVRAKYLVNDDIFTSSSRGGSQFWKRLVKIKHLFKLGARHVVHNGQRTLFWTDCWQGADILKDRFPLVFAVCDNQQISVASVVNNSIRLRRSLSEVAKVKWVKLLQLIDQIHLSEELDSVSWSLEVSGQYSVASMYAKLAQGASVAYFCDVWAAKLPQKIKIFSWQLILDRLPSGQVLASRQGPSDGLCALCGMAEDASHMFFSCSLAKFAWSVLRQILGNRWCPANFAQFFAILSSLSGQTRRVVWALFVAQSWTLWNIRNKLSIERRIIKHPADVIYKTLIFLQLWCLNAKDKDRPRLEALVGKLKLFYTNNRPRRSPSRRSS